MDRAANLEARKFEAGLSANTMVEGKRCEIN